MKTINIAGKTYRLPAESELFLQGYLKRVRDYVSVHKLDPDLIFDIELSCAEKIEALQGKKKKLDEKEIIRIVTELGEPADMFQEMVSEKSQTEQLFAEISTKGNSLWDRTLGRQEKIFLGVIWKLSQKYDFPAGVLRLLTILMVLFVPKSIPILLILYFGSYFLLGRTSGPKKPKLSGLFRETIRFIERVFTGFYGMITWLIRSIKTLSLLLWTALGGFFRFVFFAILGFCFAGLLVMGLILGPLGFVSLEIGNQDVFAHVPDFTQWFGFAVTISAAVLAVWGISRAFGVRAVSRLVAIFAFVVFVGGIFGLIGAGYQTASHYLNLYGKTQAFEISVPQDQILQIAGIGSLYGEISDHPFLSIPSPRSRVELLPLVSGEPRIEITRNILAGQQSEASNIFQKTATIELTQAGNRIEFSLPDSRLFLDKVPLTIMHHTIRIYLPKNAALRFYDTKHDFVLANVWPQTSQDSWGHACEDELIFYDELRQRFVCEIDETTR